MKKLIVIALVCLIGCTEPNINGNKTEYVLQFEDNPLEVIILDSCEYYYKPGGNTALLTHKGNCKNHKTK